MSLVAKEVDGPVHLLTLHDPARRNALSAALLDELIESLRQSADERCRALILRAIPVQGVWSSGHDIDELPHGERDPLTWDNPLEAALRAVRDAPFPIIAQVDGSVWGGACDLAFTCDLVVAIRSSTFAITPVRLGIPYNTAGVAHFVSALPVHIAKEMFFTAAPMPADRLAHFGVVNRLTEDAFEAQVTARQMADHISALAPLAIAAIKAEITSLTDAGLLNSEAFERLTSLRNRAWTSSDYQEGLAAFHEKRPARFTGN